MQFYQHEQVKLLVFFLYMIVSSNDCHDGMLNMIQFKARTIVIIIKK